MSNPNGGHTVLPPNTDIQFRDEYVEPERRQAVERSVETLVSRYSAALERTRAAEAELAKLSDAVNAPLARMVRDDQGARQALEVLRTKRLIDIEDVGELMPDRPRPSLHNAPMPKSITGVRAITVMYQPFDFSWHWHSGHAPFNLIAERDGRVGIDARSGAIDGGASGDVAVHVGVGLVLTTPFPVVAQGWSILEPGRYIYALRAVGIGSNATTEGGVEVTALENGQLIASLNSQWWRRRISANESASDQRGPASIAVPLGLPEELTWTMQPGREYTFNVGIWAFTDRSTGIGAAAVQAVIQGVVSKIWISR
jgi:hypothetical protein